MTNIADLSATKAHVDTRRSLGRRADVAAASVERGGLIAHGVSFRGPAHALYDEPRQDSFALVTSEEHVVVAVSDGIGSCPHSQLGSAAAVQAVVSALGTGELPVVEGAPILARASAACRQVADDHDIAVETVRATLTVAAVETAPQEDGSRRAWLHGVGDSPAFLLDPAAGTWSQVTPTDDGPANRVRSFVPDGTADNFSVGVVIPRGGVLVVATDGFSGALGDGQGPVGQSLAALWQQLPDVFQFGRHVAFDHGFDDKTVLAIWSS